MKTSIRTLVFVTAFMFSWAGCFATEPSPKALQPTPDLHLALAGKIYAVLVQADEGVIIGGEFSSVNGVQRKNLARIGPDGFLDANWRADTDGTIYVLSADGLGNVYVGGAYLNIQGQARFGIARIATNGQVDPVWAPAQSNGGYETVLAIAFTPSFDAAYLGGEFAAIGNPAQSYLSKVSTSGSGAIDSGWNAAADGPIHALAVDSTGFVYAGGYFQNIGGVQRLNLARLAATTGIADPGWSADADGVVHSLLVEVSGRLYVGGEFQHIGSQQTGGIARLLGGGVVDDFWYPPIGTISYVLAMSQSASGDLFVGGSFSPLGAPPYGNLAKVRTTGVDDGAIDWTWLPSSNNFVYALDATQGEKIAIGGLFTTMSEVQSLGFAQSDALGVIGSAIDAEKPGKVSSMAVQPDGGFIVGGEFLKGGGLQRRNLLRVMPNGNVDPDWNPSPNGIVDRVIVDRDVDVYAAGRFTSVSGVQRSRLAKIGAGGIGTVDSTWPSVQGGYVYAMLLADDGSLYVGGSFLGIGGIAKHFFGRIRSDGSVDQAWNPPQDRYITGLAQTHPGFIAASTFLQSFPINLGDVKRVSTEDGSVARTWTLDRAANGIRSDGQLLYVYGDLGSIDGTPVSKIGRIAVDGNVDSGWMPQFNGGYIYGMDIGADSSVFLAGTMYLEPDLHRVLRIPAGTSQFDTSWDIATDSEVFGLSQVGDDSLLVAGTFTVVDGEARAGFAKVGPSDNIFSSGFESPPPSP
ncbi:MAG: delta-60 repeat domain-containing protein [Dokdonella sp.]|nr:delta-60 repeat domain-containing protein [Dokdonella sp.]